jgi:uncharacterized protein YkwD
MRRFASQPLTLVGLAVALASLSAVPAAQVVIGSRSPDLIAGSCYNFTNLDRSMANATNGARKSRDISLLKLDPELSRAARQHTKDMIRLNLLHHDNAATARRVTNFSTIAENVGHSPSNSVSSTQSSYMASPDHRPHIIDRTYRFMGVGAISKGGALWTTVLFEKSADPGTTLKMPRC